MNFDAGSVSCKLTYPIGYKRFARNPIPAPKSADLAPNGVLQLLLFKYSLLQSFFFKAVSLILVTMFSILYNLCLLLVALVTLPKLTYQLIFHKKYRTSLKQRFGFDIPAIEKGSRPLVWIHAVSMGETKAIAKLVKLIKAEMKDVYILISSVTETGHAEAKRSLASADAFIYLPFDFSWIIRPLVKRIRPDLVIVSETDLWYNFLHSAKEGSAKTCIVNGKLSEKSFRRMQRFPFFSSRLFSLIDLFLVQNEDYRQRLIDLHVDPQKIKSTGNLKLDEDVENLSTEDRVQWKKLLGIQDGDQVLVIGSTHPHEEKLILSALQPLRSTYPNLKLLVVPRHPERFNSVAAQLSQFDPSYGRLSQGTQGSIMLIDGMGLLKKCFQVADLAIIGGSFVPGIGGHNILEPSLYGVPVLFGPYMHNQPDFVRLILKSKGGEQLPAEQLFERIRFLLENPDERRTLGRNGQQLLANMRGSTQRTWDWIRLLLAESQQVKI